MKAERQTIDCLYNDSHFPNFKKSRGNTVQMLFSSCLGHGYKLPSIKVAKCFDCARVIDLMAILSQNVRGIEKDGRRQGIV
jgi:hypothetical protein